MSDHLGPHLVWNDDDDVDPGVSAQALDAAETTLGRPLPEGVRTFLLTSDGRQGELRDERDGTESYVRLHPLDELVDRSGPDGSDAYDPDEETLVANGIEVGDDGGDEALVAVPEGAAGHRYVRYDAGLDEILTELGTRFDDALVAWVHEFDDDDEDEGDDD